MYNYPLSYTPYHFGALGRADPFRIGGRTYHLIVLLYYHCTYPMSIFIHESSNERDVYHASHVMHVHQMAIMHCMDVLYPHMHCMHVDTYKIRGIK